MPKVEYDKVEMVETDMNFSCIVCATNHTHIAKYKGRFIRYCEECLELLEDDVK